MTATEPVGSLIHALQRTKRTMQTSTGLKHTSNFYTPPTHFMEVKTDSLNFKPQTRIPVVKTDSPNFYKLPTHFGGVKTDYQNFFKPQTRVPVVKTHTPNFYMPLQVKKNSLRPSRRLIHGLELSKWTQNFYKPYRSQNRLSELL